MRAALYYAMSVLAVLSAYLAIYALGPALTESCHFLIFLIPVLISAHFLGRGPGLLATSMSSTAG